MSLAGPRGATALLAAALAVAPALPAVAQTAAPRVQGPPAPPADAARPAAVAPDLFGAVDRATEEYPAIQASRTSARAAAQDVRAAKQLRLPSVGAQGVALGTGGGLGSQLVLDQPLYTFGRIGATIDRARADLLVREASVDEVTRTVALDTVDAYYEVVRLDRRAVILEESRDLHRDLRGSIANRVDQGVSAETDLDLARTRTAQIEQDFALSGAQRNAALARLRQLVGDPGFTPAMPAYDPRLHHPAAAGAVEQALACNPLRDRIAAQALVARAETRQAKAAILPQLSAQLSYNDIIGTRAGIAVTAQTTGGLSQLRQADAAALRQSAAETDIVTAEREARQRIESDLVENQAARERVESSGQAARSARDVTESYRRLFTAGRRSWLDVMNAVREDGQARLGQSDTEVAAMASAARILLQTCRWQPQPRLAETGAAQTMQFGRTSIP